MKTQSHWYVSGYNDHNPVITNDNNDIIATVEGYAGTDKIDGEANARLIATAPELLAAIEEFIACGPNAGHNDDLLVMARAAIAKAKGE